MTMLPPHQRQCLEVLAESFSDDFNCLGFSGISQQTALNLSQVKRAVRRLAKRGYAEYHRGLFRESGEVAGSGYSCTSTGKRALEQHLGPLARPVAEAAE